MWKEYVDWTEIVALVDGQSAVGPLAADETEEYEVYLDEQFVAHTRMQIETNAQRQVRLQANA
ncbi:MAG: hypothetical protein AB8B85_00035 [Paracoccaceae bacterium]